MDNGEQQRNYDKFLHAFKAFDHTNFTESDYYILQLTAYLFDVERQYELLMDTLRETCVELYGQHKGTEIYKRLLDS